MFRAASDDDIEAYSDSVTCFIRTCIEDVIPTKTICIYPNQKPWINSDVRSALSARTSAFKSGGQNGQQHLISPDPQHWCPAGAAFSAHSCTPCTHTTVQLHTAPTSSSNFADDTTVIGLITDNDETAYREEVSTLTKWCQENHLSLNIDKTKELVVDFRRQSRVHTPISIDKTPVERVNSFKFLGVHITEGLTWSAHTDAVLKKAHQRLFFLRRLRKFGMSPSILRSFYTCTVESILTGCITAWFGNSTAGNRKALQRVVRTARPYCWRWASLPPGHLHQAVYKESQEDHQGLQPSIPQTAPLCCPQGDVSAASDPALADWGTAFSLRLSG